MNKDLAKKGVSMNSPLLDAYKQGTKEYKIASDNYEYGYQQGKKDVIDTIKKYFKSKTNRTLSEIEVVILLRELENKKG